MPLAGRGARLRLIQCRLREGKADFVTRARLVALLGAFVALAASAGVWFLGAPHPVPAAPPSRRILEDAILDKASEGMRQSAHLRLRFTDDDGRPLDDVEIASDRFVAGGWEGKHVREEMKGNRVFDLDLTNSTTVSLRFSKEGYYGNVFSMSLMEFPADAKIENGRPLVERTVVLMRTNGAFPEIRRSAQLSLGCAAEDDTTTFSLVDVFSERGPKEIRGCSWPLPEGSIGLAFAPVPAPGVEVRQRPVPLNGGLYGMEDSSPRDYQVAFIVVGGDAGDGFIRVTPLQKPSCMDHFPVELASAPEEGYAAEVRLAPSDFNSQGNPEYVYFYYRFKGHYGKILLQTDETGSRRPGNWTMRWSGEVVVNAKEGDRNLRMPPCN